ncbi:hypothetical protein FSPOR_8088 [Fusarium sporotrichioides]|uniref:SET domain-containing protein n=1 Tax=Fusarium sporotrichioides TaxID=5514 RepID=A0A395RVT7_FUSSP|nr:hypothetical protein FSPOR_8088 [Fusarium sporotrichioides]
MDIIDGSEENTIVEWVAEFDKPTGKAKGKKGKLVKDHPPKSDLTTQFVAKLLGKCLITPSSAPGACFVEQVLGTRYPFPNGKVIDEHLKSIPLTRVAEAYPPCAVAEKDLKPISISEMCLDTQHRGRKVLLHILTPPDRDEAVMAIVEDEEGTAVLLQLFQQPEEKQVPCIVTILEHTVCIVKDPFFQRSSDTATDGPLMMQSAYYSLRVDHPSDIICLSHGNERIPEKWREETRRDDYSSGTAREEGNKSFRKKQYTQALAKAETLEDKQLAHLNRSLTNLKLGRPAKALSDATQAYDPNTPSEKALFRHVHALYGLQEFEQCEAMTQALLDSFPDSKVAQLTHQRVKSRLQEQRTGTYNFKQMYEQAKTTEGPPLIDCATFSGPVEIRDSLGRGRGLFTRKDVSAGGLLLVEKAFSYSFIDEAELKGLVPHMVNSATNLLTAGASANLWPQVIQKLEYQKATVPECDEAPVVDSFLVEKIISLNSFGCPRTTRDFLKNNIWSGKKTPSTRERPLFTTVGVWLLAARINHSCIGNCRRSFIGDIQIIRAARDIPAGTELTFPYRPSNDIESYEDVKKGLAKWGFMCDCEICKDRLKTTEAVRVQQKDLNDDFMKQLPSDELFDFEKATKLVRGLEKTYRGKSAKKVRWRLADLYGYIGIRSRQDGEFVEAAESLIKALEAMCFIINGTPPGNPRGQSHFKVKH